MSLSFFFLINFDKTLQSSCNKIYITIFTLLWSFYYWRRFDSAHSL